MFSMLYITMFNKMRKAGKFTVDSTITLIIGIVVLFTVLAQLYPIGAAAGDDLNASGFPLGNFFITGGILWLVLAAGLVVFLVKKMKGSGK